MPALPSVSKVIRFDFRQLVQNSPNVLDRLFLQYTGALSNTDLATVLTTVNNAWNTNIAPLTSTALTLWSILGTDLTSSTGAQQLNTVARVGTSGVQNIAAGTALVVRFKIARRYRGGHPRWYQSGMGFVNLASNTAWTAGVITNWTTGFAAFIAACVLAPPAAVGVLSHVNVHYFSGFHNVTLPSGRQRAVPTLLGTPTVDPVISYSVNPTVASQRRRNRQSL